MLRQVKLILFTFQTFIQGAPLPEQEQTAIDSVMQYAIHKLGFMPDSIALFAWSIGGYSATWAAMNYPDVSFVVSVFMLFITGLRRAQAPCPFLSILISVTHCMVCLKNCHLHARVPFFSWIPGLSSLFQKLQGTLLYCVIFIPSLFKLQIDIHEVASPYTHQFILV